MQLYALNGEGQIIHACQAIKQVNYFCLECSQVIRMRGGPYRQTHFYHLEPPLACRQSQKGLIHLHLQMYFLRQLSPDDCQLEVRFPSIQRVADVAWPSQKIIFEIQYSPISGQEVLERNRDYQKAGWEVIWILHEERYNKTRLSSAEIALCSSPHFFTNMNREGKGILYDQFEICHQGIRFKRLPPLPIHIHKEAIRPISTLSWPLKMLKKRALNWKLSLEGDLFSLAEQEPFSAYLKQADAWEKQFYPPVSSRWRFLWVQLWKRAIYDPYHTLFRFILERMCR